MSDLLALIGNDAQLKRVASTNGGEFAGNCPRCGGKDRFRVWPNQGVGGRYWCRGCGWRGDDIQYLRDTRGLNFVDALAQARGESLVRPRFPKGTNTSTTQPSYHAEPPAQLWQAQARQVIEITTAALWEPGAGRVRAWLKERGLTDDTLRAWHVGYCSTGHADVYGRQFGDLWVPRGVVIPNIARTDVWALKIRLMPGVPFKCANEACRRVLTTPGICPHCGENNKYRGVKGNRIGLFGIDHLTGAPDIFAVEGEFDAILLWQELNGQADVLTLGGASGRVGDEQLVCLLGAERFHLATDADEEGEQAAAHWLKLVDRHGWRVLPPGGCKDVTEAYQKGAQLSAWARAAMHARSAGKDLPMQYQAETSEEAWWARVAAERGADLHDWDTHRVAGVGGPNASTGVDLDADHLQARPPVVGEEPHAVNELGERPAGAPPEPPPLPRRESAEKSTATPARTYTLDGGEV